MSNIRESECRQRLLAYYADLGRTLQWLQGRERLSAGSVYTRRRRCGKAGCRCVHGQLHEDKVVAVRRGGRIEAKSVKSPEAGRDIEALSAWRRYRDNRRELAQTFQRLRLEVDRLGRLRQISAN